MTYVNGIKTTDDKCIVQIKVNGKLLCRTFSVTKYGSLSEATQEARRFVQTRKSLANKVSRTGVKNVYENVAKVNNTEYLYLRAVKGNLDKSICIGRIDENREALRATKRYSKALSKLSGLLVEKDL